MTLLNLLCGCLAIMSMFYGRFDHAMFLIIIALFLDFFDGFVARLLKVTGDLGKQLDSLADMVSFGVVPGMVMHHLFMKSNYFAFFDNDLIFKSGKYGMFIVTIFSCLRLAKFNIDTRQTDYFIGVPTPLNTIFIMSLPFIIQYNQFGLATFLLNPFTLIAIACLSSYLLVAEIPMLSLKVKKLSWKNHKAQIILLVTSIIMILLLKFVAAPLILILYVFLSILFPPSKLKII